MLYIGESKCLDMDIVVFIILTYVYNWKIYYIGKNFKLTVESFILNFNLKVINKKKTTNT